MCMFIIYFKMILMVFDKIFSSRLYGKHQRNKTVVYFQLNSYSLQDVFKLKQVKKTKLFQCFCYDF